MLQAPLVIVMLETTDAHVSVLLPALLLTATDVAPATTTAIYCRLMHVRK
jgi:hypothetical protein